MFGVALETSRRNSRVGSCLAIITTCNYLTQLIYLKQDKPEELRDDERPKWVGGGGLYFYCAKYVRRTETVSRKEAQRQNLPPEISTRRPDTKKTPEVFKHR